MAIDTALRYGGNRSGSKLRICAQYMKNKAPAENAVFLMKEYREGGRGFFVDGDKYAAWYDRDGIRIARGDTALQTNDNILLSWEQAGERIGALLASGQYMPQDEIDRAWENEIKELSASLWYLWQNTEGDYFIGRDIIKGGYPEDTARLSVLLTVPDRLTQIIAGLTAFAQECEENPDRLRFRHYDPKAILRRLTDLQLDKTEFTADEAFPFVDNIFITQDEIDTAFISKGAGITGYKYEIYRYFLEEHTPKERVDFLKRNYSTASSQSNALSGADGSWEEHTSKGITFRRSAGDASDEINMTWRNVVKHIDKLNAEDRYMTPAELDEMPEYEKYFLSREILFFYRDTGSEAVISFPSGYYDALKIIRPMLDDPAKMVEIKKNMGEILSVMPPDARYYETRKQAYEYVTAYVDGVFSLFNPGQSMAAEQSAAVITDEPHNEPASPDRTTGDVLREAQAVFTRKIMLDEAYLNARKNADEQNAYTECQTAVQRIALDILGEDDKTDIYRCYADVPKFQEQLIKSVFRQTYTEPMKALQRLLNPKKRRSVYEVNYDRIEQLAGDVLTGKAGYAKLTADGYMDLHIQNLGDDTISMAHYFLQDGDSMADPDMTFRVDNEHRTIEALTYQQDSLGIYQEVYPEPGKYVPKLKKELNRFAVQWLKNIKEQGHTITETIAPETDESQEPEDDVEAQQPAYTVTLHPELIKTLENSHGDTPLDPVHRIDYRITDMDIGRGNPKLKFKGNIEAIRLLKQIESENRLATADEQEILAYYVGWGGLSDAFDSGKPAWEKEYTTLKELLTDEEYAAARSSTLNAHYTTPVVIKAMYNALAGMGFRHGNILEPAMGVGNFFGMLPEEMQSSRLYGVELDSITGRIAKQLYQNAGIQVKGFEQTAFPDHFFDIAVGNVPFGNYQIADPRYDKHRFLVHDYFVAKTLDQVRPGGIVAVITSKGTMDKESPKVRKVLAQRADLLGAIRLPNNAFKDNAGTSVTADILFFQKRDRIIDIEPDWVHLGLTDNDIPVNSYFAENPHMMLGTMTTESTMYGHDTTLAPIPGAILEEQLAQAVAHISAEYAEAAQLPEDVEENTVPADPGVKNFSFTVYDGEIYYRENSIMRKCEIDGAPAKRIRGMIELRTTVRSLIEAQTEDYPEPEIRQLQQKLNILYDHFIVRYGHINSRANRLAFRDDADYPLLCSLEVTDRQNKISKADMFHKRTIRKKERIDHADTSEEALTVSLNQRGFADVWFMAYLTGKKPEEVGPDLSGLIYANPQTYDGKFAGYETAGEYLSGNVREKLRAAEAVAVDNPFFAANTEALRAVQPEYLEAADINVRMGAIWISQEDYQDFIYELLDTPERVKEYVKLRYIPFRAAWTIEHKGFDRSIAATETYGTGRASAYKIIEDTMNLRDIRIYDYETVNGKTKRLFNEGETIAAQQKQAQIKEAFRDWIFEHPERRTRLVTLYNEKFNCLRLREYDGSHLTFPGMNPEKKLRKHQVDAVARALYDGNAMFAHVVGSGKTYEMIASAMELKRLNLARKSMFVVPNHLVGQWGNEFMELYPSANILMATERDFERKNRRKFCARIAAGDYDAVIIGHSAFEKIPMSPERAVFQIKKQVDEITAAIKLAQSENSDRVTVKKMESFKKGLENKLVRLVDNARKDNTVTFEQLGVDQLFIDESQHYKNMYIYTKMRNVAGIPQNEAQKSTDLFMKCQYINELSPGRGIVFATGTPISNSMVEMYTIQRYLQLAELNRTGLTHFDEWASTFGETVTAIELAPEGNGYRAKTRFSRFTNLPELMTMFCSFADIKTADMLPDIEIPKLMGGGVQTIITKPTDAQKALIQLLSQRAEKVRRREVRPDQDNMLCITNDGRAIALDQHIFDPSLPDDPGSKVNTCAQKVFDIWRDTAESRSTQLVFSDLSTPNGTGISVYDDVKRKLVHMGVPENEVAFIHDAKNSRQKEELFAKVRSGEIRVLLGSTSTCGAGTNIQDKLIALHHLDVPWRPSDVMQRDGRILRQGNENDEVQVYRYVTEGTFDAYSWQILEQKMRFISQIMSGKCVVRNMEDIDEVTLSYAEVKALASGNPLILEKNEVDNEVHRLKVLKAEYQKQRYRLQDRIGFQIPSQLKQASERLENLKQDTGHRNTHRSGEFQITIGNRAFTDKEAAGQQLLMLAKNRRGVEDEREIGQYGGFMLLMSYNFYAGKHFLTLRSHGSYTVEMGESGLGNITRLDNALDGFEKQMTGCESQISGFRDQLAQAQTELDKPFKYEAELSERMARQTEINTTLDLDRRPDDAVMGSGEGEEEYDEEMECG